ncbi:hypothetical protein GH733_001243 [Mirounga leonina]|nr:hypothetical protein GH733_001243 [Mirounga leonina]
MPVPSRQVHIGRSQSWDAAGWYEGPWEVAKAPARSSSLADGGTAGPWYEPQGAVEPYLYREAFFNSVAGRKSPVADFAFYDSRQAVMSGRGGLLPWDYCGDAAGAARAPKEARHPRDPGLGRSLPDYGVTGSRMSWDQVQGRVPALQEAGQLYRDPAGRGMAQGPRTQSRAPSPTRCAGELAVGRYATGAPAYPASQLYNDVGERPVDSAPARQAAPTCLVVDPAAASASDGTPGVAPGTLNRGYGPARSNASSLAADENYEADLFSFQGPRGRRSTLPEFLALLRAEGVAEATLVALLQQGFDSPAVLATMEDADIKCVAPNLGQARVLSRLAGTCRTEMQLHRQGRGGPSSRMRSSSFSHRGELHGDLSSLGASALQPQPVGPLQAPSPRAGDLARRPSSAPSQHLLETAATYSAPGGGAQAPHFPSNSGYSSPTPCALTARLGPTYPPQAGVALTHPGPATPLHPGPRTAYSTAYTVPMELLKRERGVAASPLPSPHGSPQVLRKPSVPMEPATLPPASQSLHTPQPPYQKVARRTGAPIIVSTMLAPEPTSASGGPAVPYTLTWLTVAQAAEPSSRGCSPALPPPPHHVEPVCDRTAGLILSTAVLQPGRVFVFPKDSRAQHPPGVTANAAGAHGFNAPVGMAESNRKWRFSALKGAVPVMATVASLPPRTALKAALSTHPASPLGISLSDAFYLME